MITTTVRTLDGRFDTTVRPPGSKSYTNRALVVASLATGTSAITGALEADDTVVMRQGLRQLGVRIDDAGASWRIEGRSGRLDPSAHREGVLDTPITVDVGASGTTARFLTAAATLSTHPVVIDGTDRMRRRPIGHLVDALNALGGDVMASDDCPPVHLRPASLHGGRVTVDMSTSSQFLSAVLLIAPVIGEPVTVGIGGRSAVSRPYLDSTVEVMAAFGADVSVDGDDFSVASTGYRSAAYSVEPDASAAAYPLAAAAITGGHVVIEGLPPTSTQPDMGLVSRLEAMGCRVDRSGPSLALSGPAEGLRPVMTDMTDAPDAALALAVVAAFADGTSRIDGLSTLRMKETDRLAALEAELTKIGARAIVDGDALVITPGPRRAAQISTYDDHRMAMAFAVAGLVVPGVAIEDPECVSKTWPDFFAVLDNMH